MTLSTRQVAARLNLSNERVRALVRDGTLKAAVHPRGTKGRTEFRFEEADVADLEARRVPVMTYQYRKP